MTKNVRAMVELLCLSLSTESVSRNMAFLQFRLSGPSAGR